MSWILGLLIGLELGAVVTSWITDQRATEATRSLEEGRVTTS